MRFPNLVTQKCGWLEKIKSSPTKWFSSLTREISPSQKLGSLERKNYVETAPSYTSSLLCYTVQTAYSVPFETFPLAAKNVTIHVEGLQ